MFKSSECLIWVPSNDQNLNPHSVHQSEIHLFQLRRDVANVKKMVLIEYSFRTCGTMNVISLRNAHLYLS